MKVIVGLGNPGEKYVHNRHNIGFVVVDRLFAEMTNNQIPSTKQYVSTKFEMNKKFNAEIAQIGDVMFVKPQTFMNDSGRAVTALVAFYKVALDDLYVAHDDLDIALGAYKIQHTKGPRIHNGVNSVETELGSDAFWRVRVGVENRPVRGNKGIPGVEYSLQNFRPEEEPVIAKVIKEVCQELTANLRNVIG